MSQLMDIHDACLSQVHGLYGPGSMVCWYLLILSCMVQWTSQPHRKGKDSISLETVAVLLFPLAAAWHLMLLSLQAYHNATVYTNHCEPATCQASKAIEAPTLVIYIWLTVFVFIYPLALVYRPSFQRLSAFFLVFIAGLVAASYSFDWVINSFPAIWKSNDFLREHHALLPMCYQIVGMDIPRLVSYRFASRERRGPAALEEQVVQQSSRHTFLTDWFSDDTLCGQFMSFRLIAAADCIVSPLTKESWWWWAPMLYVSPQQWKRVLPETASSWGDADQLVPIVGGCMVLAWNLYQVKISWHHKEVQGVVEQQTEKLASRNSKASY